MMERFRFGIVDEFRRALVEGRVKALLDDPSEPKMTCGIDLSV